MTETDCRRLAEAMFPDVVQTPADYEALYPPRSLKEGARVVRFAPSPTGYLHFGALFAATVNYLTAKSTGGVFYFRLEDTDAKREVEGGAEDILAGLEYYGIAPDEGARPDDGPYAPYQQSLRAKIYAAYARDLVCRGLAYPCFCTAEQLAEVRARQEADGVRTGYYAQYASCRSLDADEAIERIRQGAPYTVRLRAPGDGTHRIRFDDCIKGTIEMPENDQDIVLLKTDGIPTYHFAHAVDDHLMRTTHVVRGDEWIASVPLHVQLFSVLGFKPPKYAHISPIMKEEDGGKRKLSKRKDPEAAVHFYTEQGYPADSVAEYLLTVANSDFEEWRRRNPDAPRTAFPFNLKKMSVSGALFDLQKLNDISKNVIAVMDTDTVTDAVAQWAREFDPSFYELLSRDTAYARGIFDIDRGGPKPRKDLAKWSDAKTYAAYFFDELFSNGEWPAQLAPADIAAILEKYATVYDETQDKDAWFATIRELCPSIGFCPDVKEYKKNPDAYKGHVGDVSTVIRIAVTGRSNTPDLCAVMKLLGRERVLARLADARARLAE